MNKNDIAFGKKGEEFFKHFSAFSFFYEDSLLFDTNTGEYIGIKDLRNRKIEGEFILPDGSIVEVKSDSKFHRTGNIIVEFEKSNGDVGWFRHCRENGVKYLLFNLFHGTEKLYPYLNVLFEFDVFDHYVSDLLIAQHKTIYKKDDDGSVFRIMPVNLQDAIKHCNPVIATTDTPKSANLVFNGDLINDYLKNAFGLKNFRIDPNDCIIQTVFRSNDLIDNK